MLDTARIENAYADWAERLVTDGWTPYLLTFMFRPIGGSAVRVAAAMEQEIERVYTTFLPRVVRHPRRAASLGRLPIWLCAPDFPVRKYRKSSRLDVFFNNGRHFHATAFQPAISRMSEDLDSHFVTCSRLYIQPEFLLDRIDVQPITYEVGYVTAYGRKAVSHHRIGQDETLIFPRSLREL